MYVLQFLIHSSLAISFFFFLRRKSLKQYFVFCFRSWRNDLPKGACVVVETSVEHPDAPVMLGGTRGIVLASRYLIEPCGSGKSRIMHLSRVDTKWVLWIDNLLQKDFASSGSIDSHVLSSFSLQRSHTRMVQQELRSHRCIASEQNSQFLQAHDRRSREQSLRIRLCTMRVIVRNWKNPIGNKKRRATAGNKYTEAPTDGWHFYRRGLNASC